MRAVLLTGVLAIATGLSGCAELFTCSFGCGGARSHRSTSLVEFLYPNGAAPPAQDAIPQLRLPLRVGLAFLPSSGPGPSDGLSAAQREELLERIRARFVSRKFIAQIVVIPDYYLNSRKGLDGLQGVQRLYGVDLMALVSYDQLTHDDLNRWSLGYLSIVGAYVLKGNHEDFSTLIDLAVVDPATRSLVLRAGGTDTRRHNATAIDAPTDRRTMAAASFSAAADQMIGHFDTALADFEGEVRAGRANVHIVHKNGAEPAGGGGAFGWPTLMALATLALARRARTAGRWRVRAQETECVAAALRAA